jgi:vacuolar-type H+-ATPase subunit C/Vma6
MKVTTSFTHQNPLSIQNILDYMFGKHNESINLMRIIKGKQLGVDDAFIESMVII